MFQGNVKALEYFREAVPIEGLMADSVINSQKDSLVYLAKGQAAYGLCHLVHPLTTHASISEVRTFSPPLHAVRASTETNALFTQAENS